MNRANLIEICGPSHSTGYNTAGQEYAWPALVCSALGAFEANYASNGMVLATEGNGYARYLRPAKAIRTRTAAPYVSPVDAVIFHAGIADLANNMMLGGAYTPTAFRAALSAMLAFAALAAHFDADPAGASHASIAYGGSWYDYTGTDRNTGTGARGTATVGATLTITVPPDFPGGEIDLFWLIPGFGSGGTWKIIVDGATRYSQTETIVAADGDQITNSHYNMKATRLAGLNAGAHTITATYQASAVLGVLFDGWGIRAVNPPALICAEQPRFTDANFELWLGSGAGDTPTAAGTALLNRTIADVADQAGASFMPLRSIHLEPALYTADGAHPNERGHALWAAQAIRHLASIDNTIQAPTAPLVPATFAANWGNDTTPYAPVTFQPRHGRRVRLAGRAKRTGTPSTGETIATLPEGLRPPTTASYVCPGSTGTPTVTIDAAGAVKYAAGSLGASGTIDLDPVEITVKATQ